MYGQMHAGGQADSRLTADEQEERRWRFFIEGKERYRYF